MRKIFLISLIFICSLFTDGCSFIKNDIKAEETHSDNRLIIYADSAYDFDSIVNRFSKIYEIDVEIQYENTNDVLLRIIKESYDPKGDIMLGGLDYSNLFKFQEYFEPYVAGQNDVVSSRFNISNDVGTYFMLRNESVIVVNNDSLSKIDADINEINNYDDLLKPLFKNNIVLNDPEKTKPAYNFLTNLLYLKGVTPYDDNAWIWFEKLKEQNVVIDNKSNVCRYLEEGDYALTILDEESALDLIKKNPDNISIIYPKDEIIYTPIASSIIKGSKNKDNAELFINWLLSDESQNLLVQNGYHSICDLTKEEKVLLPDLDLCYINSEKWLKKWKNIFESKTDE